LTDLDDLRSSFNTLLTTLPGAPGVAGLAPFGVRFLREALQESRHGIALIAFAMAPLETLRARWESQVLERGFLAASGTALLEPPHRLVDLLRLVDARTSPIGRAREAEL